MAAPMDLDNQSIDDQFAVLLNSSDRHSYVTALKNLADQSREDLVVRNRLAQTDVLQSLVQHAHALPQGEYDLEYEQEMLRCIGNACAMNQNAIRTISTLGFDWVTRYTTHSCSQKLQYLALAVLFNISAVDFSADGDDQEQENPALRAYYTAGIHIWLVEVLVNPRPNSLGIEDLIDMLFWISSSTLTGSIEIPTETMGQLVNQMQRYCPSLPPEALGTLIESVVTLLRPAKARLAEQKDTNGLFTLLQALEDRLAAMREQNSEDVAVLLPQSSNLTWLLSDVAAEPTFATSCKLHDPLVASCMSTFLQSSSIPSEQVCVASCLVLGNALLNIPETETTAMVHATPLVDVVVRMMLQEASPDLLHAASGLLTVICRPKEVRNTMGGNDAVVAVVAKLCKYEVPQIRDAGVRLLKALGRDSPRNQERLAAIAQAYGNAQATQRGVAA